MTEPRTALEAIGVLPDTEIDIGDAALQLARVDAPDADWQAARAHLSDLARDAGLATGPENSQVMTRGIARPENYCCPRGPGRKDFFDRDVEADR